MSKITVYISSITLLLIYLYAAAPVCAGADTVLLKSGKKVEGTILEKTDEYVKIDSLGTPVYFERKFIDQIEESALSFPSVPTAAVHLNNAESYLRRGLLYAQEDDFMAAEEEFIKGLQLDPSDANMAGALNILQDVKNGLLPKEYALEVFSGAYYLACEDYRQAAAHLLKAYELRPYDMDVCYNLGVAYYSFGEYEKAAEYLDKEVRERPEDAQGHGLLGSAYYLLGRNDKAREHLGKAKQLLDEAGDSESAKEIEAILQTLQQSESVPES